MMVIKLMVQMGGLLLVFDKEQVSYQNTVKPYDVSQPKSFHHRSKNHIYKLMVDHFFHYFQFQTERSEKRILAR